MNRRTLYGALGCAALLATVATALAAPRGFAHGAVCVASLASANNLEHDALGIRNTSTTSAFFITCPITLTTDSVDFAANPTWTINAEDSNTSSGLDCTSAALNSAGNLIATSVVSATGDAATGDITLTQTITTGASLVNSYVTGCRLGLDGPIGDMRIESIRVE
jgi:hypothetical protein